MSTLTLSLDGHATTVTVHTAIIAGWTGRDPATVEKHIAELAALGVPRPSSTPIFYRVSASRLTTEPEIESTPAGSGEAEAVLVQHGGRLWVGAGSDHTDRDVEAYSVAASKQLCDKPMAGDLWAYEEVAGHWDRLTLRSWIDSHGTEVLYQEGDLAGLVPAADLIVGCEPPLSDGTVVFCGTLPTLGGVRPARTFRYALEDPVLGRGITGRYTVRDLPLVS
jgi:hypothetical protein